MANLYGTIQGSRGAATRTGSRSIRSTVETWEGIVSVDLDGDGNYIVRTSGKYGERSRIVLEGNVNDDSVSFTAAEPVGG